MNLLPSEMAFLEDSVFPLPYPEMETPEPESPGASQRSDASQFSEPTAAAGPTPAEIEAMHQLMHTQAIAETEKRLRREYEEKLAREAARIGGAIDAFAHERQTYFSQVESEVVRLALAIAARVLHREAQVDPMLLAALVRVAIEKMHEGTSVTLRVAPGAAAKWREYLGGTMNGSTITVNEDPQAGPEDCILETELGTANFAIESQLKEVEQGFFDLLAHRPSVG
jgi:flagellar assembly protein FliH